MKPAEQDVRSCRVIICQHLCARTLRLTSPGDLYQERAARKAVCIDWTLLLLIPPCARRQLCTIPKQRQQRKTSEASQELLFLILPEYLGHGCRFPLASSFRATSPPGGQ